MPASRTIAGAAEALANDDPRTALIALLDVWRRYPDVELARAIEHVGARAVRGAEIPSGLAELDAYKTNDPVLRHHLLSTTNEPLRLEQLATERDPRVAARVLDVIRRPTRKVHGGSAAAWKRIFALLVTAGDPRVVDALPWLAEAWAADPDLDCRDHTILERRLGEVRRKVIATFTSVATLPSVERIALGSPGWFARIQGTHLQTCELVLSHRVWIASTPRLLLRRPGDHWTLELAECGGGRTNLGELANALATLPPRRFAAVTIRPYLVAEQPALGEQQRRLLT